MPAAVRARAWSAAHADAAQLARLTKELRERGAMTSAIKLVPSPETGGVAARAAQALGPGAPFMTVPLECAITPAVTLDVRNGPFVALARSLHACGVPARLRATARTDCVAGTLDAGLGAWGEALPVSAGGLAGVTAADSPLLAIALVAARFGGSACADPLLRRYARSMGSVACSPIMWPSSDLELLQGSPTHAAAIGIRKLVDSEFDCLRTFAERAAPWLTAERYHVARVLVAHRRFAFPDDGESRVGLVPGADAVDSHPAWPRAATTRTAPGHDAVVLSVGDEEVAEDSPLFFSYTDERAGPCLVAHGFVPGDGDTHIAWVPLSLEGLWSSERDAADALLARGVLRDATTGPADASASLIPAATDGWDALLGGGHPLTVELHTAFDASETQCVPSAWDNAPEWPAAAHALASALAPATVSPEDALRSAIDDAVAAYPHRDWAEEMDKRRCDGDSAMRVGLARRVVGGELACLAAHRSSL